MAISQANSGTLPQTITHEQVTPGPAMLYRDLAACNIFDCMARMSEITLPALIICGEDDRMTPVKYSQFLQKNLPGSTLRIIPKAGHYVMREAPEAVSAAMKEWLESQ